MSDQLTTLTIQPDGSADWLRFQSNIRSTEKGAKGAEELERFVADFEAGRDPDCVRIRELGGKVLEARWARRKEPFATIVTAKLPNAASLQNFLTFKNEKGQAVVRTCFTQEGQRRRLTLAVRLPKNESPPTAPRATEEERRREQASGFSETRFAVSGGEIVAARGFTVAGDRRSALLEPSQILDLVQAGGGKVDLFLEWELPAQVEK